MTARWLEKRIGYGRLDAPYWFLGMEERGERDEIFERMQSPYIEDVYDAHATKWGGRYDSLFAGERAKLQSTWKMLIRCLRVAKNGKASESEIRAYQAEQWGRVAGETLVAELYPIASPSLSNDKYKSDLLPARIRLFRELLKTNQPRFVIAYGKPCWDKFKRIFDPGGKVIWRGLPKECGPGLQFRNVALIEHPTAKGQTNDRFNGLGCWARQFVS